MNLDELMLKRRSVRKYLPNKVEEDKIDKLLHYAMSGPSAVNRQPWEFYVVTNEDILDKICKAGHFTKHYSPLKIVVCGNTSKALPLKFKEYWVQDCSAAIENILLGVTDMGLGACWEGVYPQKNLADKLSDLLKLPSSHIPLAILSIGYSDEDPTPRDQYNEKKIHYVK